jgi:hypothetical protein
MLTSLNAAAAQPSAAETALLSQLDGKKAYSLERALENLTREYPAYRSSGSAGCNASAAWILQQMQGMGLSAHSEAYSFPSWDLRSKPTLSVAPDGVLDHASTFALPSFNCEQWSGPTQINGTIAKLVTLPLPAAASYAELEQAAINRTAWNAINITGKVLVIGSEFSWITDGDKELDAKVNAQRPLAIIQTFYYAWNAYYDEAFVASARGRTVPYLYNLSMPCGMVNYTDGQKLFTSVDGTAIAAMRIDSFTWQGVHQNIVGIIPGSENQGRQVLITAHYDSVIDNGFCDNGAGVAGMLEIARVLSAAHQQGKFAPRQSVVFIAFAGEELGLIGSLQYVSAHQTELSKMDAIINLDCLGNSNLTVTPTRNVSGVDIRPILLKASADLGVRLNNSEPGGSDQESFMDPVKVKEMVTSIWGVPVNITPGLNNSNAVLLLSYPVWNMGEGNESGWIHTLKDAQSTTGWVSGNRLQEQMTVTTLAVLRATAPAATPQADMTPFIAILIGIIIAMVILIVYRRKR